MIVKTKEAIPTNDKFEQAGNAAEEQMAFYLRRAFGDDPEVFVFNDLRLANSEDAAQMDHLIIHRFGVFIVESKSVSGKVIINEHGEWIRVWGRKETGMSSPITQAQRQGEFLQKRLDSSKEQLRDKRIFGKLQPTFQHCPINVYAAISDKGIIKRKSKKATPEICKADQVCDRIKEEIARHRKANSFFGKPDGDYGLWQLKPEELDRVVRFLLEQHTPREDVPVEKAPSLLATSPPPIAEPAEIPKPDQAGKNNRFSCKHCQSENLVASYGRYGYYFKCTDCDKNTPMDYSCGGCGAKGRIRKSGSKFHRVCAACGAEVLTWEN